jgi:hypothetical protein
VQTLPIAGRVVRLELDDQLSGLVEQKVQRVVRVFFVIVIFVFVGIRSKNIFYDWLVKQELLCIERHPNHLLHRNLSCIMIAIHFHHQQQSDLVSSFGSFQNFTCVELFNHI